jgi:hypothetical protein
LAEGHVSIRLAGQLDFTLSAASHKCFTAIIILIILLSPKGQAGKYRKCETKQCSLVCDVVLGEKKTKPSGCFYNFVGFPVFQINTDTVSKFEVAIACFSCSIPSFNSPK